MTNDPRVYFCPRCGQLEDPIHGGFDTCCDRPDLHVNLDQVEEELRKIFPFKELIMTETDRTTLIDVLDTLGRCYRELILIPGITSDILTDNALTALQQSRTYLNSKVEELDGHDLPGGCCK